MDDPFSIEFRRDHIHVELSPELEIEAEQRTQFWERLREACNEHDTHRVLVEGFVPPGEHDSVEVIEAGQRTATIPNLWLAFHLENFEPTEKSELYEAVAASRGVRVKFFSDAGHALNWLRSNTPA